MPDCLIDDIAVKETSVLLLPGANTWSEPKHGAIIEKARELRTVGATVGALLWAKQIIEYLGFFRADTLELWYEYFSTGKAEAFFALMQTTTE